MPTSLTPHECTAAGAAAILGVSTSTIRRYENEGLITARRTLGGQRRFQVAELERLRAEHDSGTGEE